MAFFDILLDGHQKALPLSESFLYTLAHPREFPTSGEWTTSQRSTYCSVCFGFYLREENCWLMPFIPLHRWLLSSSEKLPSFNELVLSFGRQDRPPRRLICSNSPQKGIFVDLFFCLEISALLDEEVRFFNIFLAVPY